MLILLMVASVVLVIVFSNLCLLPPSSETAAPLPSAGGYHIENKQVYFSGADDRSNPVGDAHAKTFQVLAAGYGRALDRSPYARDFQHVYYEGKSIEGANPVHFQILGPDLGRDDQNVFKACRLLSGDAKNFKCLDARLSKDSHRVFFDDKVISEDAGNFRYVCRWQKTCVYKDRSRVFVNGRGYRVADIDTFDFAGNNVFSDLQQTYRFNGTEFQAIPQHSGLKLMTHFEPVLA
nr:DKNYY domain-containing protein [uncultured Dyadobacter sp.]